MAEVFKIQNVSTNEIELIDFGLVIPSSEIVELGDFDQTILSSQLDLFLQNGDIVRLINDSSVSYEESFNTTIQIYQFDSSSVESSINTLFNQDLTINSSLGLRPTFTYVDASILSRDSSITVLFNRPIADVTKSYVDASLNAKVSRTLFDASILSLTNKDISQDASLGLRPLTTYVDASLNLKVNKAGDTMTGDLIFSGVANRYIRRDTSTSSLAIWGGNSEANGAYFQITGSGYSGSPYGGSAEFVIRNLPQSTFSLFSYDGASTWTPRFSLSGNSGLATFSNDVSITGSLRIGNDLSIGTNLPYAQIDKSNGNKIVSSGNYYGQNYQLASALATTSTSSTSPQTKVTLTTPSLPAGTYKVTASWVWSRSATNTSGRFDLTLNGTPQGTRTELEIEVSDNTDIRDASRIYYLNLSGVNTILLRYWAEGGTTTISDATIELIRVS